MPILLLHPRSYSRLPAFWRPAKLIRTMPLPLQVKPDLSNPPEQNMRPVMTGQQASVSALAIANASGSVENGLSALERSKQLAAWTAVDNHVEPEHMVIGIGSGSTVPYVVERIKMQGDELNKRRVFIPTGFQSKQLIVAAGLSLGDVDQYPTIDITLDGADEVDKELNCIKGGGACHLREKVVAEAALRFILVADDRKNVERLGTNFAAGVPIEVISFAYAKVLQNLHHHLDSPKAALRMAKAKAGPVVTDNGNFIIDAPFEKEKFANPYDIMAKIKLLTGVVEVGLFCHMAQAAYFGNADGSVTVKRSDGTVERLKGAI